MLRFEGRTALITGAASGIGAGVAERLATEGAQIGLIDRDGAALEAQARRLRDAGASVVAVRAEVQDEPGMSSAIAEITARSGRLDILVHCAGIVGTSDLDTVRYPVAEFRRVLDVNLVGSFVACKHVLPPMLANRYGRILLIASIAGKEGNPRMAGYVASKAALIGLVKGMAKEYATAGITVNALAPAVIATPMNAATDADTLRGLVEKIPMRRLGTVAEVSAIACWICSDEASFNTGAVFDLSGGRATY